MRRKIKPIDPNELFDADDINKTTIKGEMRKLYVAIHQKLSERDWSARDMVKWLDERGLSMSVELFRVYLRDLDREVGYSRSKNERALAPASRTRIKNPVLERDKPGSKGGGSPAEENELVRPSGLSNAAWSEMKAKHRAAIRKQKLNSGE